MTVHVQHGSSATQRKNVIVEMDITMQLYVILKILLLPHDYNSSCIFISIGSNILHNVFHQFLVDLEKKVDQSVVK